LTKAEQLLYLIGGPARSGKSLLARRLLLRQAPYFCTDYLTTGLAAGVPSLGVDHELPCQARGELIWPVLVGVLRNLVEVEPEYVVEGGRHLEAECQLHGIRFFDGSLDFNLALQRAERYLVGGAAAQQMQEANQR
jgi:hypothetical protein